MCPQGHRTLAAWPLLFLDNAEKATFVGFWWAARARTPSVEFRPLAKDVEPFLQRVMSFSVLVTMAPQRRFRCQNWGLR